MQEVYLFSYRIRGYEYFFVPHKTNIFYVTYCVLKLTKFALSL